MKGLFESLKNKANHSKFIQCPDAAIRICSSRRKLVDMLCEPLFYLFPEPFGEAQRTVTCIVEYTTTLDGWPDTINASGPKKHLENDELGTATIIPAEPGATVVISNVGSIYHSGDGHFLCLIKPPEKELEENELKEFPKLAIVLVSETLLLVDKLLIHAGCVGRNGNCEIWTGSGGSGKTTRIINLVNQGWDFYGEDQLIVGRDESDGWSVWPYWRQIKATPETCRLFPTEQDLSKLTPNKKGKYSFGFIEEVLKCERPRPGKLVNINLIVPGNKNILKELDFTEAFSEVAPGFLHALLPDSITQTMDTVLDLLSSVPARKVSWDMLDQINPLDTK